MRSASVLTISEFKGQSSNSPRGTVMAPELLLNVNLDRTGGYTPMYARSRRISDVTAALTAGIGNDLFITRADGQTYYAPFASPNPAPVWAGNVNDTTALMPGLLLNNTGSTYILTTSSVTASGAAAAPTFGDDTSTTANLRWSYTSPGPYDAAVVREWLLVFERGGTVTFSTGPGFGTPPATGGYGIFLRWFTTTRGPFAVYTRTGGAFASWQYVNANGDSEVLYIPNDTAGQAFPPMRITPRTATYHKGRVFVTGVADYTQVKDYQVLTTTENTANRLYFSEIIAKATPTSLPRWSPLNFIDVPFKASREIVALASVGSYLYIFGDRELLILTGDPATDANIESIGDSIGAVDEGSVQQLSGVVFWRSDSGVMAAQGASVKEVGQDVRDVILSLNSPATTTVDFKREQYVISDGTTILAYHAREGGWTQRSVESGGTPSMIYGGGTPYMQQGTTLYSIGGESGIDGTPTRMQMRVRWPRYELGSWLNRKVFDGLCVGMDLATQSATINNLTTVDADTLLESDTTLTVTPGNRGAKLHTIKDGVGLQGVTISVELTVDSQDTRAILRPPLVVYGSMSGEEDWFDNGI